MLEKVLKLLDGKISQTTITPTDNHAGWNLVASGTEMEVSVNKNMISLGLTIEGELQVEGYLSLGD